MIDRPDPGYRGRFAPSPTGPLHAGSLVAALASWLDARAHHGRWLVRIEDIDPPREVPGATARILAQLAACGLAADEPPQRQRDRSPAYEAALGRLQAAGLLYRCTCSRQRVDAAARRAGLPAGVYPGTCRGRPLAGSGAIRIRVPAEPVTAHDRRLAPLEQALEREVGDFVLRRADGLWAYQLAVVVDDGEAGITDVVRGDDLWDNTPRQVFLQRALGLPTPRYLHVPVVAGADGEKLSKQNGARAIDIADAAAELERAWRHLRRTVVDDDADGPLPEAAIAAWARRWAA